MSGSKAADLQRGAAATAAAAVTWKDLVKYLSEQLFSNELCSSADYHKRIALATLPVIAHHPPHFALRTVYTQWPGEGRFAAAWFLFQLHISVLDMQQHVTPLPPWYLPLLPPSSLLLSPYLTNIYTLSVLSPHPPSSGESFLSLDSLYRQILM